VAIGERWQPDPRGRAGYLRLDTVHQGQHDGQPGVYHIKAVDTVTQWQVVGCAETISEQPLIPVLEVEEFTKSRAYRTTDNALVESKNGAVVRKQIGYGPIASSTPKRCRSSTRGTSTRT
jgi:hypothetical protein